MPTRLDSSTAFSTLVQLGSTKTIWPSPALSCTARTRSSDLHCSKHRGVERAGRSCPPDRWCSSFSLNTSCTLFPQKWQMTGTVFGFMGGPAPQELTHEERQFGCWWLLLCTESWLTGNRQGSETRPKRDSLQRLRCPSSKTLNSITSAMPVPWKI